MNVQAIRRLEDVRPGDIYLGPIGGPLGTGIRAAQVIVDGGWRVGPLHVEHIGIVVEASQVHEGPTFLLDTGRYVSVPQHIPEDRIFHPLGAQFYPTGVITAPRMVQAMPRGAEEIELSYAKHWTPKVAYARIPEDYPGQAADAAAIARLMVSEGVAYSFASYAALALWHWGMETPRLEKWIGRRREPYPIQAPGLSIDGKFLQLPVEAICSVLADQCWTLAGKRVMEGTAPQAVTPSQLGQRLLTGMEGVIWGWPVAHPYP